MYCVVRSDTYAFRTALFAFRGERDIAEKGQAYKIGGGSNSGTGSYTNAFWKISLHRMCDHYLPKLLYALSLLNKEEIWRREAKESNSIGRIALHICEHVRRNMLEQQNRTMPFSRGIEEHFPQLDWTAGELGDYVQRTFVEWKNTMNRCINGHEKINLDLFRL